MRSRHDFEVATWSGQREVATRNEVVTWSALVEQKWRRDMDMMSRHGWQCGRS